jgi:O-antigen ligase
MERYRSSLRILPVKCLNHYNIKPSQAMREQSLEEKYSRIVNALIFIFPIVIISIQVAGDIVLFIFAMIGIYIAISKKISPFNIKEIKFFSYLTMYYFSAVCLSVLFSGQALELAHYIPRDFYFLFAPFIALTLYKVEINFNYLLTGIKVAFLILAMIIINQLSSGFSYRPSGVINPAVFGNLSVSMFFILLVYFQNESFKQKIFTLLSLFSGVFIIIISGTRGAWLSFLILSGAYLYLFYKQKKLSLKSNFLIGLIIASVIIIGGSNQLVQDRTYSAYEEISNWESGSAEPSNVGLRLEMYTKAIENIKDVPFFGHGYRTSNIVLFKNDSTPMGKISVGFNHLHNAYLTNYYNGGIVLLGALLLLLFIPLRLFIKANSQNREDLLCISGALLILGYASHGMVNILLGDTYMNGFYVFFLAIFMVLHGKSITLSSG